MTSHGVAHVTRRVAVRNLLVFGSAYLISSPATAAQKTYGVILPSDNAYYTLVLAGIHEAADKLGNIQLKEEPYSEPAKASTNVNNMVSSKVDGLLIAFRGNELEFAPDAVKQATNAGIPIVAIGRSFSGASANVSPDFDQAAKLQAQLALSGTGSSGPYIYVTGPKGETSSILEQAFSAAVGNAKIKIINVNIESYTAEETIQKTAEALSKEPKTSAIAAASDFLALNAFKAAEQTGAHVKIIGLGATSEGVQAVARKELVATIDLKPKIQGSQALTVINSLSQKGVCPNGQNPPCPPQLVAPGVIIGDASIAVDKGIAAEVVK